MTKRLMYHQVGASLYFCMSLMCTSGFSDVLFRYCCQMLRLWCRYVYTTREAMAANDRPYDIAKVVL